MDEQKVLFIQWCADDALGGTANMSPLTELVYRRIIDLIYSTEDNLLDNDSLQYATKAGAKWKKIRHELINVYKKITIENGFIRHDTCTKQIKKAREYIEQKAAAGRASAEARKALKENNPPSTGVPTNVPTDEPTNHKPLTINQAKDDVDVSARVAVAVEVKRKVGEIIGRRFDDPTWYGDFQRVDTWLAENFDPELDIYPTLNAVMGKKRDGPPQSLNYFDKPLANAKARRLAPMPEGKNDARPRSNAKKPIGEQAKELLESIRNGGSGEGAGNHLRGPESLRAADRAGSFAGILPDEA